MSRKKCPVFQKKLAKIRALAERGYNINEIADEVGMTDNKAYLQTMFSRHNIEYVKLSRDQWKDNYKSKAIESIKEESLFYGLPSEVKGTACGAWV